MAWHGFKRDYFLKFTDFNFTSFSISYNCRICASSIMEKSWGLLPDEDVLKIPKYGPTERVGTERHGDESVDWTLLGANWVGGTFVDYAYCVPILSPNCYKLFSWNYVNYVKIETETSQLPVYYIFSLRGRKLLLKSQARRRIWVRISRRFGDLFVSDYYNQSIDQSSGSFTLRAVCFALTEGLRARG